MDGFFRILKKTSFQLFCTRLYICTRIEALTYLTLHWCDIIVNSVILEILTSFSKRAFNMKVVFLLLFCVPLVTSGR